MMMWTICDEMMLTLMVLSSDVCDVVTDVCSLRIETAFTNGGESLMGHETLCHLTLMGTCYDKCTSWQSVV